MEVGLLGLREELGIDGCEGGRVSDRQRALCGFASLNACGCYGTVRREHIAKVFVSDMHAKSSGGSFSSFSPGPNAYSPAPSIGIQATSRGRSAPSWGFGKSTRFKQGAYETGSPGPGAYAT